MHQHAVPQNYYVPTKLFMFREREKEAGWGRETKTANAEK
jgi:hypothetical protein